MRKPSGGADAGDQRAAGSAPALRADHPQCAGPIDPRDRLEREQKSSLPGAVGAAGPRQCQQLTAFVRLDVDDAPALATDLDEVAVVDGLRNLHALPVPR